MGTVGKGGRDETFSTENWRIVLCLGTNSVQSDNTPMINLDSSKHVNDD